MRLCVTVVGRIRRIMLVCNVKILFSVFQCWTQFFVNTVAKSKNLSWNESSHEMLFKSIILLFITIIFCYELRSFLLFHFFLVMYYNLEYDEDDDTLFSFFFVFKDMIWIDANLLPEKSAFYTIFLHNYAHRILINVVAW